MHIRKDSTALSKIDPLRKAFSKIVELLAQQARVHVVAGLGEFIGTAVFIFMASAAAHAAFISSNNTKNGNINTSVTAANSQELFYVALDVSLALVVTAWTFFRISGGRSVQPCGKLFFHHRTVPNDHDIDHRSTH